MIKTIRDREKTCAQDEIDHEEKTQENIDSSRLTIFDLPSKTTQERLHLLATAQCMQVTHSRDSMMILFDKILIKIAMIITNALFMNQPVQCSRCCMNK